MEPISLYFHIPFCIHRCSYCDFNTYAGLDHLIPEYVDSICKEVDWIYQQTQTNLPVHTIFFGGGTPSLIPAHEYEKIFKCIHTYFHVSEYAEVSLEANPGTVSPDYLKAIQSLGFNRISFGMQTANPHELLMLERQHNFWDVIAAVSWARKVGFTNINLDLIFGLPDQSMESWLRSLSSAVSLKPDHLALYALSIEHGTPFEHWMNKGLFSPSNPDLAADMYEQASIFLKKESYAQYEVSNWAKTTPNCLLASHENPQLACQHNLQYWHNRPYLGFGAGAHGFANGFRTENVRTPKAYIQRLSQPIEKTNPLNARGFPYTPACINFHFVDKGTEIGETLMMGLRLIREGVTEESFNLRFGQSLYETFHKEITRLEKLNLVEWVYADQAHLRLTTHGRLLGNQVFSEFI